jgi:hypothetical protein
MLEAGCVMSSRLRQVLVLALLVGLATAASSTAQTQTPSRPVAAPPSLSVLTDQIVSLFPKIDGDVIEVQGTAVTLGLGKKDGVVAGIDLEIYREGRELRHPKTGASLGRTEQPVGRMQVQQVFEAYSTGTAAQGTEVRPGDKARVSSGKIKLSLLSAVDVGVKPDIVEAVVQEVSESLNRSGRFQVGMGDAMNVWLGQQGIGRQDLLDGKGLAPLAARFKVDTLLIIAFTRTQAKPYMDVRLFTFPGPTPLMTTALFVPPSIRTAPKGDFSASTKTRDNQTPNPPRSFLSRLLTGDLDAGTYSSGESAIPLREIAKFPFAVTSMDVAVWSKDKIPRMVVTDGERVFLYRIVGNTLEAEWTYKADVRGQVFSVQLAELTGDGTLHVVVNRYHEHPSILITSFILGSTGDGKPSVIIADASEILMAVDETGDGIKKTLWTSPFAQSTFFKKGDVTKAMIQGNKLVTDTRVRVPNMFRATGATLSNISGKGSRALAFVDDQSRMRIALDSEELFRSAALVGGGPTMLMVKTQVERGGRSYPHKPEPAPLAVDLDGDGVDEIVVPQNQFPGRLAVIFKGPGGYRFQTVNSGFEGTISALGAIPSDDGTTPRLVVAVVHFTNMFNTVGETQIILTSSE